MSVIIPYIQLILTVLTLACGLSIIIGTILLFITISKTVLISSNLNRKNIQTQHLINQIRSLSLQVGMRWLIFTIIVILAKIALLIH